MATPLSNTLAATTVHCSVRGRITRCGAPASGHRVIARHRLQIGLSEDDVRSVAAPTLLITGERSPAYPLRLTDRLQQLLPNVERVEIAGASHLMHEENAAAVNRAILSSSSRARRRPAGRS